MTGIEYGPDEADVDHLEWVNRNAPALAQAIDGDHVRQEHSPFPNDGVLYCGWFTGERVIGGCGWAWPCPTVRGAGA